MMRAPGKVFTRAELHRCLEGEREYDHHRARAIDVHIGNLRKKIADLGGAVDPRRAVRGVGYRFMG